MTELILDLLALNMVIEISKYGFQLKVSVSSDDKQFTVSQLIPRDKEYIDNSLISCARFCIKQIIELRKCQ